MGFNRMSLHDRFFDKVYMSLDGHWYWIGASTGSGYGHIQDAEQRRMRGAHEISFELHGGVIPPGKEIDHTCRIRLCVNPRHLRPLTHRANVLGGTGPISANAQKTHCLRGHEFDEANTKTSMRDGHPRRLCRKCAQAREKKRVRSNKPVASSQG